MVTLRCCGRARTLPVLMVLVAVTFAACSKASESNDAGRAPNRDVLADVVRIDAAVDAREQGQDYTSVADRAPVAAGDTVRTDTSGFAEVAYHDGSRTRLDVNTEFEILELSNDPGEAVARAKMGLGRTWNRVKSVGQGDEAFSIETSVATATVRGTAFAISCAVADSCTFTVVEGGLSLRLPSGQVIELTAPAAVTVTGANASPPMPVPFDVAFGDDWVLRNATRDIDAGFSSAADIYQKLAPSFGSLQGGFDVTRTITSCTGGGCTIQPAVGNTAPRRFDFDVDCSKGFPCEGTATFDYARVQADGAVTNLKATEPLAFDGMTYTWSFTSENPFCSFDDNNDGTRERQAGRTRSVYTYEIQPSLAEVRDGKWVATSVTGKTVLVTTVIDAATCTGNGDTKLEASLAGTR